MWRRAALTFAISALAGCATPPAPVPWAELAAQGPILTVAELNERSAELHGKTVLIDAYMTATEHYYMLSGQKTETCSGERGPAWGLPDEEGQELIWFELYDAPYYARQFGGQRVVLSATMSSHLASEPSFRSQYGAHVQVPLDMRGPLKDIKILAILEGRCDDP